MEVQEIAAKVKSDPRYVKGVEWGRARIGHPEGTVAQHIVQLEKNLAAIASFIPPHYVEPLSLLIHVHDTFKYISGEKVFIESSKSHASLAANFLSEFTSDPDIIAVAKHHDTPFACWCDYAYRGMDPEARLSRALDSISKADFFALFLLLDGLTEGKHTAPIRWTLSKIEKRTELPHFVTQAFERLRVGARDSREEIYDLVPGAHEKVLFDFPIKSLGPVQTWGAYILLRKEASEWIRPVLQALTDRTARRYAGVLTEVNDLVRLHISRYPRRENHAVRSLDDYRLGFKVLVAEFQKMGMVLDAVEERPCTIGGMQRGVIGLVESTLHSVSEVRGLVAYETAVTEGKVFSTAPGNYLYEEPCVILTGIGKPARQDMFKVARAFSQPRFSFESLAAQEATNIELIEFAKEVGTRMR